MKQFNFLLLLLVIAVVTSCSKSDEQASGAGDAIIVSKKIDGNVVYGVSLYAYTYSEFKSVTAVGSANTSKTYTLKSNQGYKTSFYYDAPDAEFSSIPPQASTYTFSAVFQNGDIQTFDDVLTSQVLPVPVVTTMVYSSSGKTLTVSWNTVPLADSYAVSLTDENNHVVYSSDAFSKSLTSYSIPTSGTGWISSTSAIDGKTYKLKLFAFAYESEVDFYNVQATSFDEKSIVWAANPVQ